MSICICTKQVQISILVRYTINSLTVSSSSRAAAETWSSNGNLVRLTNIKFAIFNGYISHILVATGIVSSYPVDLHDVPKLPRIVGAYCGNGGVVLGKTEGSFYPVFFWCFEIPN